METGRGTDLLTEDLILRLGNKNIIFNTDFHLYFHIEYESGALVPRAFPSKRQFVSERLNAFKLSSL